MAKQEQIIYHVTDVMEILGFKYQKVNDLFHSKGFPGHRAGRYLYTTKEEFDKWFKGFNQSTKIRND